MGDRHLSLVVGKEEIQFGVKPEECLGHQVSLKGQSGEGGIGTICTLLPCGSAVQFVKGITQHDR
jgi:hypothetical protein